jgi:Ca2+-binding RTX toxin-like protein
MQTITFSEQLFGSFDPVYKCKIETIKFHGQIVSDSAQVTSPVIAHDTSYMGPVSWTFSRPADHVEFDAGYFNDVSSTTVKFFDADGKLLKRFVNTVGDGFQHFVYDNDKGIARVVVNNDKDDQAGFAVDNMAFSIKLPEVKLTDTDDINGLLWGWKWEHKDLTYSFPTSSAEYTTNGYQSVVNFEAMNAAQQTAYAGIIANFGAVCGLSFAATAAENADIRFGEADQIDYSDGRGAHTPAGASNTAEGNPPDPRRAVVGMGDVWFNHTNYNDPTYGSFAYAAGLMHELGHSLGLKHGHVSQNGHGVTFPKLPENHNSYEYSVMTYHQYVGDTTPGDNAPDHPTTLMQDDIAALQYLYGADFNANKGNTIYTWDADSQMLINGTGQGVPINKHALLTIWDGGGTDIYDFSNKTDGVVVNLAPGAWTTFGALADLGSGHMARGNVANALLYKDNNASLIENATGGSGKDKLFGNNLANTLIGNGDNDRLNGGKGNDKLTGNDGNDTFIFSTALNKNTNLDSIMDFSAADDSFLLDRKVFKTLTGNVLNADAFFQGGAAQDGEDRIIYNDVNGSVLFDIDGKGGQAAVKFAQISAGLTLSNADFLLAG